MPHSLRILTSILAILFLLAACTPVAPESTSAQLGQETAASPVQVVATTNFVADWARVVGGSRVEVFGLLPVGGDPHTFLPGARDVARVADADLVLTVGLGLEADWLQDLLHNASADESKIVALGEGVDPIEFAMVDMHDDHGDEDEHGHDEDDEDEHGHDEDDEDEHGHDEDDEDEHGHDEDDEDEHGHDEDDEDEHGHDEDDEDEHGHDEDDEDEHGHDEDDEDEHGHDEDDEDEHGHDEDDEDEHGHDEHHHGPLDPHFWFDPIRVKVAVNEIAARLSAIDPEGAETYLRNAAEYGEQLDELHAWVQEQVSAVAPERRLLVTSHDAFSYFAELYGFEIVGLVIPSLATHVEPSAEHIAALVEVVREHDLPALFGETTVSERLAQTIATETGAQLFRLFSGSLGPEGSGADTYLGMVRTNVERIVEALK